MGSLRESVLLLLIIQKDRIEHAATRMLTQAQVNPSEGPKAYDEYVKLRYPYLETAKKREKEDAIKMLMDEVRKGPLIIRAKGDPDIKSRLRKKIQRVEHADATGTAQRLMTKIGRSIPL